MDLPLAALLARLSPNGAVLLASLGLALIFVEFNRPGRVLPGAAGLLLTLLAVSRLLTFALQPWAVLLLAGCGALYVLNAWRQIPAWLLALTTLVAAFGLRCLIPRSVSPPASPPVSTSVAVLCGGLLGTASALLTRVAHRARRAKALD